MKTRNADEVPDLFSAAAARDRALERVAVKEGEDWITGALRLLEAMPIADFTGEDARGYILAKGYPEPHHHNVWGAVIMTAVRRGQIIPTGQYRRMTGKRSHARATAVYRLASRKEQP